MALVEAQVTQVVGRRPLAGFARLGRQGQVRKVVSQGAQAVHDVGEGAAGRGALVELVGNGLLEGKERKEKKESIGEAVKREPEDCAERATPLNQCHQ